MKFRTMKNIFKILFIIAIISIYHEMFKNSYTIFLSNKWVFNFNVSQYSSIIRESLLINNQKTKLLTFESTIFSDIPESDFRHFRGLEKNLLCLILTDR